MKSICTYLLVVACSFSAFAQQPSDSVCVPIVLSDDPDLAMIDSMLVAAFSNHFCFTSDTTILNVNGFGEDSVPGYSAEVYKERLTALNEMTPLDLGYNEKVHKFIELYANRRRAMTSKVLGLSEYYFPMFEQVFDKYDIPYEMKYLAIVESALNPQARSHAGAVGLWQFMHATGKMHGLQVNSYLDERMDPWKSTDAACRYLQSLYDRYNDWNLALAAYNSGPGNVNKAIRRSGGKRDYWAISPYLPRETRSYVPAFIAVNYVMNYASDHNIYPIEPNMTFFECDTVIVSERLKFDQLAAFTNLDVEEISGLNPSYKRNLIPKDGRRHNLVLPTPEIGVFLSNEDSIYSYMKEVDQEYDVTEETIIYRVRRGDVLGKIAQDHHVSVSRLKEWNNLRGNTIHPGQKLTIYLNTTKKKSTGSTSQNTKPKVEKQIPKQEGSYLYHIVQSGDTLWDIAKLYDNVTVNQLEQLNRNVDVKNLKLGQKIKIQKVG
jgi:membrane-bound lytic murein transglycosylase D